MVCVRVFGNDAAIAFAGSQGQLQLNVYKPLMAHALLESITLLTDALRSFDMYCARGIAPRPTRISAHLHRSLMLATALVGKLGYDAVAQLTSYADANDLSLRDANEILGMLPREVYDRLVDPLAMAGVGMAEDDGW